MISFYQESVIPCTPNGGGNYNIERSEGGWVIVAYLPFSFKVYADKRKLKRAIYRHISYVRKEAGSIDHAFDFRFN